MAVNSVPTAGAFPTRHSKREAKVIETALSGTGTLTNKTIDGDSNTVQDLAVTSLKTVVANADKVVRYASTTGVAEAGKIKNANVDDAAAIAYSKLALTGSIAVADNATVVDNADKVLAFATTTGAPEAAQIEDKHVKADAAIARSKVAVGTADHVVINATATGALSSEAQLAKARGGCGADMSNVTFPSTGTLEAVQYASGTLTTEQVLALNAAPITLITAPGENKMIVVDEVQLFLDFNSAAYVADAGDDLTLQYATSNTAVWTSDNDSDAFLTAAADARLFAKVDSYNTTSGASFDMDDGDNEAIEITIANGEVITGDSPIKYQIKYRIINLLV